MFGFRSSTVFSLTAPLTSRTRFTLAQMLVILTVFMSIIPAKALTCYESDDNGDMVETASEEFTYCVMMPERIDENKYLGGKAFGVGPTSDSTSSYDKVFHLNNKLYQVLSMCIYERYDFAKVSPKFSFRQPEFMLRCFCNYDLCNHEKNFFAYINNLKADSASMDTKHLPSAKL